MILRSFLRWTLFFIAVFLLLYIARNAVFNQFVKQTEDIARTRLADAGVELTHFGYGSAEVEGLLRYALRDLKIAAEGDTQTGDPFEFSIEAESLHGTLLTTLPVRARIRLTNFTATLGESTQLGDVAVQRIENATWTQDVAFDIFRAERNFLNLRSLLKEVEIQGASSLPFELKGDLVVQLNGHESTLPVRSVETEEGVRLEVDETAIRDVVKDTGFVFSNEEIEILSTNPLRIPMTVRLTSLAKARSLELARSNASFPEDAFRHVYWSYLLTRQYGVRYAEEVTSAHETLPGNTQAERTMDLHNNAVGRRWAQEGVPVSEIPDLVRTSPDVVRSPGI